MKTEKSIFLAFILNLFFACIELAGGIITGSVSIISDAVHDMGDATAIGISYHMEKKSKKPPDEKFTYGYARYSVFGSLLTTSLLLLGSVVVICNAVGRIINPMEIHYNGMLLLAITGVCVNGGAAFFTRRGDSLHQKAVNLHMLEDVLGWIAVLIGALVMKFTDFILIDPLLSIGISVFILINALKNLTKGIDLLLEKTPSGMDAGTLRAHIMEIEGVLDVHHIHIWSMDGQNHYATMHVVANAAPRAVKESIRESLRNCGVGHVTLEMEAADENCSELHCPAEYNTDCRHHHHHSVGGK